SATPISIPRPIRLEKMVDFKLLGTPQTLSATAQQSPLTQPGSIDVCDLKLVKGNQMILSLHYRLDQTINGPVYAGGYLYDDKQNPVDAGYKPVALRTLPNGTIDFIMVLPDTAFKSQYIMTFLIRAGKVIVNQRFSLAFLWDGNLGKMLYPAMAKRDEKNKMNPVLQNKAKFCDDYAKEALAQYEFAVKNNLSGIVPPVWSRDYNSHYTWCLKVPDKQAIQGSNLRKAYLKKTASTDMPGLAELLKKSPAALPGKPVVDTPDSIKPIQNKGFDPGRGP
ncbi:MAG: hypothetical protein ABIJ31_06115, partial [Pseudomonadota bacterium]